MRCNKQTSSERIVKDIKRKTRKQYSAEEKVRIVLDGLRGEESVAELCRREGISQGIYYKWSKDFMEASKKRLAGDIVRQANTAEFKGLRSEALVTPKSYITIISNQTYKCCGPHDQNGLRATIERSYPLQA